MPPDLNHELTRVTRVLKRHDAIQYASWGLVGAFILTISMTLIARLRPLWYPETQVQVWIWSTLIGLTIGGIVGVWPSRRASQLRRLDLNLHLSDRLTTAWELHTGQLATTPNIAHLQQKDTLQHLRTADPYAAFPLRPNPRAVRLSVVLGLLLLLTIWIPNPQTEILRQQAAQRQAQEAAVEHLTQLRAALENDPTLSEAQREAAIQALNKALTQLQDQTLTPTQQQQALTQAEKELAALRSAEAAARAQQLREAAPWTDVDIAAPLAKALRQGDIEAAAEYLHTLSESSLSAEERVNLADTLNTLSRNMQATNPELAETLSQTAQTLYDAEAPSSQTEEALQHAADTLSDIAQANASNETLEQAQADVESARAQLGQGTMAPGESQPGQEGLTQGTTPNQGNETTGESAGSQGHSEDTGSSESQGTTEAPRIEDPGAEVSLPRPEGERGVTQSTPRQRGTNRVPYQEVYAEYEDAAEADLSRRTYPAGLRTYLHSYFSALEE